MNSVLAEPNVVLGDQRPRVMWAPPSVSSAGDDAIDAAELAGLFLDEWQQLVLCQALGERPDGKWAAPNVGLLVPRQNGKGSILEARELAGLFVFGERVIIHSAHEQATASEQFRRLLDLIEGVPEFEQRILKTVKGKGSEAIELRGGQRIFFKTRTSGGGRGFTADCLIYDEAMILPQAFVGSVSPTLAARSKLTQTGVQTWYAGSAVDQQIHEHGVVFARIREQGHAGDNTVAWFEWSCDFDHPDKVGAADMLNRRLWAQANPSLEIRIATEYVAGEIVTLGARGFAVERLSVGDWPQTDGGASRVISEEEWQECGDRASKRSGPPVFAVDVTPERDKASIGVGGRRDDSLFHVEVVENLPGTGWLVAMCMAIQKKHPRSKFVVDKRSPAGGFIPDLKAGRVKVVEIDTSQYAAACGEFFDAVVQRTLRYPDPQPEVAAALGAASKRKLGDAWAWDRRLPVDISPLVAVTLALWGVQNLKPPRPGMVNMAEALQKAAQAGKSCPRCSGPLGDGGIEGHFCMGGDGWEPLSGT